MPSISMRGGFMPASPIRKLVPYAESAKKRGVHIFHLNIGQPDVETPTEWWEAIKNIDRKVLEYSHSAGFLSYRIALSRYYQSLHLTIDPEEILVTTGGSEAVLFGLFSCLDPGDEVIIPEPFYANYAGFAAAGNIKVVPVTSFVKDGYALPPVFEIEKAITPRTKAILICNPNNPTGYLYSREELLMLGSLAVKYDLFLFSDEVYREFVYDGAVAHSMLSFPGLEKHVIVIDSVSKRYSACGARIGALVTRNKEVYETVLKFAQARLSPPTIEQIAAEKLISLSPDYFTGVNKEYNARRNALVQHLSNIPGVVCPTPSGAFYAMVKLPVLDTDHFCKWLLENFQQDDQTIMLAPGSGFYATPGLGKQEVRIAYVLQVPQLIKAAQLLALALVQYPKEPDTPAT